MSIEERSENARPRGRFAPLWLAGLLVLAAVATLSVDCPIAIWCQADSLPGDIRDLLNFMELYGHGLGVLLIGLIIYQLDPGSRWALPRLLTVALGSGMAANLVKMLVSRTRPHNFDCTLGATASFNGWLPLGQTGSGHQSFPSAHTATAVGLAFAMAWLYPRGRWLFPALAAAVALQRIAAGSHFPSDTLCGAAVGCVVATFLLRAGPLPDRFDSWEQGWRKSKEAE